jgi:hypothetical protein
MAEEPSNWINGLDALYSPYKSFLHLAALNSSASAVISPADEFEIFMLF